MVADIIFIKILTVESYIGYLSQANKNIKYYVNLCLKYVETDLGFLFWFVFFLFNSP